MSQASGEPRAQLPPEPNPGPLRRLDPFWLAAPLAVIGALFFRDGFLPNPDAYYHVKCALLYLREGWVDAFPWLPYTTLRDFPNAYLAYHLLMAPLHLLFAPERVIAVAGAGFASAIVLSAYAILRRWQVALPGLWVAVLSLGSPVLATYFGTLKGGALFFVLVPWWLHFLLRGSARGVFAITLASAYAYVGAFLLPVLAALHAFARGEGRASGARRVAGAAGAAFALGMLLRPRPLEYARHVGQELASSYLRPGELVPGQLLGIEWGTLSSADWIARAGAPLGLWALFVLARLWRGAPGGRGGGEPNAGLAPADLAAALPCLALLGYSAFAGAKLLHLFALASLVVLPILYQRYRLPRRAEALVALLAVANAAWVTAGTLSARYPLEPPETYASLAGTIARHSEPGDTILAPWGAFPGLFFYDDEHRYVAGMNLLFLLHADPARFDAYTALYQGRLERPEAVLAERFAGARLVLVRLGVPGSARLANQLTRSPHFQPRPVPAEGWLLFQRRAPAPTPGGGTGASVPTP